jgi:hypothetical protein
MMNPESLSHLSTLVDDIALEKPLDWESFNYESVKEVAIQGAIDSYIDIINNTALNESEKSLSILSILSYLIMENTMLWITIKKGQQ